MENIEYFDISRIISILYKPEHECNNYEWVESKPIKWFFGLINTGKFTKSGWKYLSCGLWDDDNSIVYSDDEMRNKFGYIVYSTDERINNRLCNKAKVTVYLEYDNEICQEFNSNKEAEEWIESLKIKSGKPFEIVKYGIN